MKAPDRYGKFFACAVEDLRPISAQEFGRHEAAEQLVYVIEIESRRVLIEDVRFGVEFAQAA
ncbi:MAG: hypothetical protein ACRD3Q_17365 [Terriglobales bacterium]